jgi:hypothetical protein
MKSKFGQIEFDKIHLQRVTIVSAVIENPLEISSREIGGLHFNVGFTLDISPQDQKVKAELEVNLSTALENAASQATARFRLAFIYSLENFDELIHWDNTGVEVSNELAIEIASISYSTARGILLTHFQGTLFGEFILPVVSPIDILNA